MLLNQVVLTKYMQVAGVLSFLLCTLSMFGLYLHLELAGVVLFGASLISLSLSLIFSLWEVLISTNALNVQVAALGQKSAGGESARRDDSPGA